MRILKFTFATSNFENYEIWTHYEDFRNFASAILNLEHHKFLMSNSDSVTKKINKK